LNKNQLLELFLEKKRSRSGKISNPNEDLFAKIINIHFENNFKDNQFSKDMIFVPVTLNYDRIHEGETFPLELLGEAAPKNQLITTLKKFTFLVANLGKVNIKYG
jgi:glycerol-3-phosphate O-acyltransferase